MQSNQTYSGSNRRWFPDTRARVDALIKEGWEIVGRSPVRLQRGAGTATIKPNGVITYGRVERESSTTRAA